MLVTIDAMNGILCFPRNHVLLFYSRGSGAHLRKNLDGRFFVLPWKNKGNCLVAFSCLSSRSLSGSQVWHMFPVDRLVIGLIRIYFLFCLLRFIELLN